MTISKTLKKYALSIALPLMVFFAFAGTIAGTFAWYTYVTKVTMSFSGTAISSGEQLQVGIMTDLDLSEFDMDTEVIEGVSYSWVHPGRDLSNAAINAFSKSQGYASDELEATTSGKYVTGNELELKRAPTAEYASITTPASKGSYQYLPLVFRIIDAGTLDPSAKYLRNKPIWLNRLEATAPDGDIAKAMRLYVDGGNSTTRFVLNPYATSLTGSHVIAGLLDLNEDGYYDTTGGQEIIYGSYSGTGVHTYVPTLDSDYVDMNNTGITTKTTFTSRHKASQTCYEDYAGLTFDETQYISLDKIKPINDGHDGLSGGTPVCYTANDVNGLGRVDLKVFIEGWDHAVIDSELNHKFNMGIQFQINRVD